MILPGGGKGGVGRGRGLLFEELGVEQQLGGMLLFEEPREQEQQGRGGGGGGGVVLQIGIGEQPPPPPPPPRAWKEARGH